MAQRTEMTALNRRALFVSSLVTAVVGGDASARDTSYAAASDPGRVLEQILDSTTRIDCAGETGKWRGTGFVCAYATPSGSVPLLVTNKHVIRNATSVVARLRARSSKSGPPARTLPVVLANASSGAWVMHPDEGVDLCAIPMAPALKRLGTSRTGRLLVSSMIPSASQLAELDAVEDVIMVGHPIRISDEVNDHPLVRRGITASPVWIDFEGRKKFLIDIACLPGSSGSPVFFYSKKACSSPTGAVTEKRLLLLGILFGAYQYDPAGSLVLKEAPTAPGPTPSMDVTANLGAVVKAVELQNLWTAVVRRYGQDLS
jgi:hypothetical protein